MYLESIYYPGSDHLGFGCGCYALGCQVANHNYGLPTLIVSQQKMQTVALVFLFHIMLLMLC